MHGDGLIDRRELNDKNYAAFTDAIVGKFCDTQGRRMESAVEIVDKLCINHDLSINAISFAYYLTPIIPI